MFVCTTGALVFPSREQHITFSFWNRLPNKTQDLSKIKISWVLIVYVTKCLFSFSYSRAAHHFLILPKPWMEITVKITIWVYLQWLRKNKWLIGYQVSWIAIARQPEFHRFYALVSTQYLTFSLKDEHDERRKSAKPYTIWAHKGKVLSPIRWTHRKIAKPKTIPRSPQKPSNHRRSPQERPQITPPVYAQIRPRIFASVGNVWAIYSIKTK